jgi:hypothetical protein
MAETPRVSISLRREPGEVSEINWEEEEVRERSPRRSPSPVRRPRELSAGVARAAWDTLTQAERDRLLRDYEADEAFHVLQCAILRRNHAKVQHERLKKQPRRERSSSSSSRSESRSRSPTPRRLATPPPQNVRRRLDFEPKPVEKRRRGHRGGKQEREKRQRQRY